MSAELQLSRAGSPRCTGYFLTKIFHPNISKTGEICVNTLKKDWRHDLGIGHVLQVRAASLFEPRAQLSSSPRLPPTLTTVRAQVVPLRQGWTMQGYRRRRSIRLARFSRPEPSPLSSLSSPAVSEERLGWMVLTRTVG